MATNFIPSSTNLPFRDIKEFLASSKDEILVIVPYINAKTLQKLLNGTNKTVTVITTWRIRDIWFGATDLSIHHFCKKNDIRLFINNRIHLKAYIVDWKICIFGSANLTGRGLGLRSDYNYELVSKPTAVDIELSVYFRSILSDSRLMTDKLFEDTQIKLNDLLPPPSISEPEIQSNTHFLISALPMSRSIDDLYTIYFNEFKDADDEGKECAIHDVILYKIPFKLSKKEFVKHLKVHFFSSMFIVKLLDYIGSEKYFGRVKEWIQSNCADVPVPSRRDLTGNIQVLYHWIVELSDGEYHVDIPGRKSERIYKVK